MNTFPYRGKHPRVAEEDAIQKIRDRKYNDETKKIEIAMDKKQQVAKKMAASRNRVINKQGKVEKKSPKCETCGRGHTNHSSYVYKTGSLG